MALLGAYKPKYETSVSGIAKRYPISSVVSMGLVPTVGAVAGKVLETGRAMLSDTGDPMAMVKGRAQQVAGELSDYTTGKAGKPTIATPIAAAPVTPSPSRQSTTTTPDGGTTFGPVGITKLGPQDLSRLSNGSLPNRKTTAAPAPQRASGKKPLAVAPAPAPQQAVPNGGLQTPGYAVPGSENITRIDNVAPGQVNSDFGPQGIAAYPTPAGGGIASNGDETFVLRGRLPAEEAAYKAQQAQTPQPVTSLAQSPPQTSTVGYGHGVYELAPGQSAPTDFNDMSLGDMATYKFGVNQQVKQAGIANVGSEITRRAAQTQLESNLQPSQIAQNNASARHSTISADLGIAKLPAELANMKATTDHTKATTTEILEMMNPKKNALLSDIKYKDGMLNIAGERLGILKQQITLRAQQAAKGDVTDWAGISKSALEAIKLLDAKAALGGLSPDDEQMRKNYLDTYNTAFVRQKRTGYQANQPIVDAGE